MPTNDFDPDAPDQPDSAAQPGAATTPVAVGQAVGVPVGIVPDVGNPSGQPARDREPDPAEAEYERLTGHSTDERAPASDDRTDRDQAR
jgi:hypothetical protein